MVFLWFSYGFPMVFLWFSYGFPMVYHHFPMVFLWFSYGLPPFSDGFPMVYHHFPMVFRWLPAPTHLRGRGQLHLLPEAQCAADQGAAHLLGRPKRPWFLWDFHGDSIGKNGDFMGFIRETNHFTEDNGSITRKNLILDWWFNRSKYGLMRIIHISYTMVI